MTKAGIVFMWFVAIVALSAISNNLRRLNDTLKADSAMREKYCEADLKFRNETRQRYYKEGD